LILNENLSFAKDSPVEVLRRCLDELAKAIPAWFKPDPDTLKISRKKF
jgi:hypothetical protein